MACQSVAASAGNDAKGSLPVYKRTRHLIDRSVAPNGHADVVTLVGTSACNLGRMPRILRKDDVGIET